MDRNMRRGHNVEFKGRVALKALNGEKTMAQLSSEYGLVLIKSISGARGFWMKFPMCFSIVAGSQDKEEMTSELYRQIDQLKVELEWL